MACICIGLRATERLDDATKARLAKIHAQGIAAAAASALPLGVSRRPSSPFAAKDESTAV